MSRKRSREQPDQVYVHCKIDGDCFSWAEAVIDGRLFEYDNLDAFIDVLRRARKIFTWKGSPWLRLFGIPRDNITDVWNSIAAHSGFVPTPEQCVSYKGQSMAEFIFSAVAEHRTTGRILYRPQNPARLPWESIRAWRGPITRNKKVKIQKAPAWVTMPCDVASELD